MQPYRIREIRVALNDAFSQSRILDFNQNVAFQGTRAFRNRL